MPDHSEFAKPLRELRSTFGQTQVELAQKIAGSRKTINTVKNGVFILSTIFALNLSAVLGAIVKEVFAPK